MTTPNMQTSPNALLPYRTWYRNRGRVWTWVLAAVSVLLAIVLFLLLHDRWRTALRLYSPNAAIAHAERTGVIPSLYEIRKCVVRFAAANGGALPIEKRQLEPYVETPREWPYRVTPAHLFPHIIIVTASKDVSTLPVGNGRFMLMVHVVKQFPMESDVTVAIGETGLGYKEQYSDEDVTNALGEARLRQLKQAAYRLP